MITKTLVDSTNVVTLINLYSQENPILEIGDICYFLFFNAIDYHIPIIARGQIMYDRFNDTINKHYFISIIELHENKNIMEKFIIGKQIQLYTFIPETGGVSTKSRVFTFNEKLDLRFFDENLIKIECFFVRKTYEGIKELQKSFLNIIQEETEKTLTEIKEIQITL